MGSNTYQLGNHPAAPGRRVKYYDFSDLSQITSNHFVWDASAGSFPPVAINDANGGGITLTPGPLDDDFIQAQSVAEIVRFDKLNQWWEILFEGVVLSDATQMDMICGLAKRTATAFTLMVDALFWRKADGDTSWRVGTAFDAGVVADYSEVLEAGVDTLAHDLAIRVETDASTLGMASLTFSLDGVNITSPYTTSVLPHDEELAITFGVMNGEAAAKSLTLKGIGIDFPLAA